MRRRTLLVLPTAVLAAACGAGGGDGNATPKDTTAVTTTAKGAGTVAGSAMPVTGRTAAVTMIGDAQGYRFDPAAITVRAGDAVRWTNASGGPHNVTFWADSVPAGAAGQLAANMPNTTGALTGPLVTEPNASYLVSFAGLKPGVYHYYCTPHLALGMKGTVTVQ